MTVREPLYGVWATMRQRCINPNVVGYPNYGGRGIKVCDDWQRFAPFKEWALRAGYGPGLEIDRRDVNGDYTPENCHWMPRHNNRNKTNSRMITAFGETKEMTAWVEDPRCAVGYSALKKRLNRGIVPEKAMSEPLLAPGKYIRPGKGKRAYIAGAMSGIPHFNYEAFHAVARRLRAHGYTVFSPAEHDLTTLGIDISKENSAGDETAAKELGFCRRRAMAEDLHWIGLHADMIAHIPGWEKSSGATAEHYAGLAVNAEMFYVPESWLDQDVEGEE